jgi:hypothetical protein
MSAVKHMPLPWRRHDRMDYAEILCADGSSAPVIAMVAKADDADLIVQAVNSHYALIEALEGLLKYEGHHDYCGHAPDYDKPCVCGFNEVDSKARAALSLAKGEQ